MKLAESRIGSYGYLHESMKAEEERGRYVMIVMIFSYS